VLGEQHFPKALADLVPGLHVRFQKVKYIYAEIFRAWPAWMLMIS
jgi:hypothetical protein